MNAARMWARAASTAAKANATHAAGAESIAAHEAAEVRHADCMHSHREPAKRLWRNISLFVALPTCIALGAVTARAVSKHNEHREHAAPTEKVLVGTYVNVRTKPFPWGTGNKTLFWNNHVNSLGAEGDAEEAAREKPVPALTQWIASQIESEESRRERTRAHVTELKAKCDAWLEDLHAGGKVMPPPLDNRRVLRASHSQIAVGSQLSPVA